jgi:hypothetical protein
MISFYTTPLSVLGQGREQLTSSLGVVGPAQSTGLMQVGDNSKSRAHTRSSERAGVADGEDANVRRLPGHFGDPVGAVLAHEDVSTKVLGVNLRHACIG